jgi:predicted Zn finger-like uncharacterized protein
LIVTCEECSTSFQLDEARIPAEGARVRCSRCKHAFFLPNPASNPAEVADSIAADAAADGAAGTPPASSDLDSSRSHFDATTAGFEAEPEEEDWQFNEEVRIEGDDDLDQGAADDFDVDSDFGEGFDDSALSADPDLDMGEDPGLSDDPRAVEAEGIESEGSGLELDSPGPTVAESEPARDESSFGTVDDFSSLMEDDDLEERGDLAEEPVGALEPDLDTGAAPEPDNVGVYSSSGASDDLGDPESWDLIGSDPGQGRGASLGGVVGSFASAAPRSGLGMTPDFLDGFGDAPYEQEIGEPSVLGRLLARAGNAVGWCITLALIAGVLYVGLQPEWARWSEATQAVTSGPFSAEATDSGWVETSRSGNLLLVRGRVRNSGRESIWPQPVQVALLDGAGSRLVASPISAGAPLEASILRETRPEELDAAREAAVDVFLRTPLAPGEVRPFEVVAREIPTDARRTLLEIAPSAPAPRAEARAAEPQPQPDASTGMEPLAAVAQEMQPTGDAEGNQAEGPFGFSP